MAAYIDVRKAGENNYFENLDKALKLKDEQVECSNKKDVLAILPTGYGK